MTLTIDNEPIIKAAAECWEVYSRQQRQGQEKVFTDAFVLGYNQCIAHLSSEFSMAVINMFCDAMKKGEQQNDSTRTD